MEPNFIQKMHCALLKWYDHNQRALPWRETNDPYAIWASEVMLQQTQVNTVIPYYGRFLKQFPTIHALAEADLQAVLKVWEGLGYYSRARNFHRAAKLVVEAHEGTVPDNWISLRRLPGIGDYIAAAVLSIAFNQPYAVIDGNVKRVLARFFLIDAPANKTSSHRTFKGYADQLLHMDEPGTYNQAMMELGARICSPRTPLCNACPLQPQCKAYLSDATETYPRRIKAKTTPVHNIATGVVVHLGRILLTRRMNDGLLGGLWEFPGGKLKAGETPEKACVREIHEETGLSIVVREYLTRVKHAYTHFKIIMDVFICEALSTEIVLDGPVDYCWITLNEIDHYPLPKANHKFLHLLKEEMLK